MHDLYRHIQKFAEKQVKFRKMHELRENFLKFSWKLTAEFYFQDKFPPSLMIFELFCLFSWNHFEKKKLIQDFVGYLSAAVCASLSYSKLSRLLRVESGLMGI